MSRSLHKLRMLRRRSVAATVLLLVAALMMTGCNVEQRARRLASVLDRDRRERARQPVRIETGLTEDPPARPLTPVEGRRVEGRGQVPDALVTQLHEVREGGGRAALGVEAHRGPPGRLALHEDDMLVGSEAAWRVDLEQQVAVDGAGPQRLEGLLLPAPVIGRVDERHGVARGARRALGPAQHAAEEGVGDVRDEQRDRPRAAEPQRLRRDIRAVAELTGAASYVLLGRL